MNERIIVVLAFIGSGALACYLGYLIRYRGRVTLLAGYDERKVQDNHGLALWAGQQLLLMGLLQAISGVIAWFSVEWATALFTAATVALTTKLALGARKFLITH